MNDAQDHVVLLDAAPSRLLLLHLRPGRAGAADQSLGRGTDLPSAGDFTLRDWAQVARRGRVFQE